MERYPRRSEEGETSETRDVFNLLWTVTLSPLAAYGYKPAVAISTFRHLPDATVKHAYAREEA